MKVKETSKILKRVAINIQKCVSASDIDDILVDGLRKSNLAIANVDEWEEHINRVMEVTAHIGLDRDRTTILELLKAYPKPQGKNLSQEQMADVLFSARLYHRGDIEDDPFYRSVHFADNDNIGNAHVVECYYEAYQPFLYSPFTVDADGKFVPGVGVIDHDIKFDRLMVNGRFVSEPLPAEVATAEKGVEMAKGRVLVLGCRIGYVPFSTALKSNVTKVTVVDADKDVLEMFEKNVMSALPDEIRGKVDIIHEEPNSFLEHVHDGDYDFCYIDTWMLENDQLGYWHAEYLCKDMHKTKVACRYADFQNYQIYTWMVCLITAAISPRAAKTFTGPQFTDSIYPYIARAYQDIEIHTVKELDEALDSRVIKEHIFAIADQKAEKV